MSQENTYLYYTNVSCLQILFLLKLYIERKLDQKNPPNRYFQILSYSRRLHTVDFHWVTTTLKCKGQIKSFLIVVSFFFKHVASFTLIKCVVPFHDSKLMQVIFDLSPWEYSLWETSFAHGPNLETVVINTTSLKKQDEPLFPQEYAIVGPPCS